MLRRELPRLLARVSAASLLDAPCGDSNWIARIDLGSIRYTGVDIVPALVERSMANATGAQTYLVGDVRRDPLPKSDVILCRDCLVHLCFEDALATVENFRRSGSRYLLATTFPGLSQNDDILTGRWRPLDLCLAPFHFPAPLEVVVEDAHPGCGASKAIALWDLEEM